MNSDAGMNAEARVNADARMNAEAGALSVADLDAVRTTVRAFLAQRAPMPAVRRVLEDDGDPTIWKALVAELGLHAIAIGTEYGGHGYGFGGQAVVLEELGRALTPVPYLSSAVLATQLLQTAGSPPGRQAWLPRLAAGEVTATVALVGEAADWSLSEPPFAFDRTGATTTVTGRAAYVTDAAAADVIVVVGRDAIGIVASGAPGLTVRPGPSLDPTRPLSDVDADAAPVELVGETTGVRRAVDVATVGLACEQLGGARHVLDLTVAHAIDRHQFGRAIGSFQSVKHMLADILIETEAAGAAVAHAVRRVTDGADAELAEAASVAKSAVSDAYYSAARTAVQVHGAIGFTWEHDLHLFLRRAMVSRELLGSAEWHRERLAAGLLDG